MASAAPSGGLVLERSRALRFFTLFILYVGQGLPIGLFWFAIPIWMAVNGASAAQVGSVGALVALPWSLKLANGFFMDRYTYLAMGRRRVWILGAQGVMIALLIAAAIIDPEPTDVVVLGTLGFIVNAATTFQDVGVDGLAVDIMSEDERARGAGMMFGGQALGYGGATALCGYAIESSGAPAAYLIVALLIFVLCVYVACFREREGERRTPWSQGEPHARNLAIQVEAWWPLLKATFASLSKGVSLLFLPVLFCKGMFYGTMTGLTPLLGANEVGWDLSEISNLSAIAGIVAGILCMTLGGWLGDRFGAKRILIMWQAVTIVMCTAMYLGLAYWGVPSVFIAFVYTWMALDVLVIVAALPIAMRLCDPKVAATQFTIYMAMSNFGISFGSFVFSQSEALGGLQTMFLVAGGGALLGLILVLTVKFPRRPEYYAKQTEAALVFDTAEPIPKPAS